MGGDGRLCPSEGTEKAGVAVSEITLDFFLP